VAAGTATERGTMTDRVITLEDVAAWDGPPLVLFVGLSTGGSLAHTVFGAWADTLDRPWVLRGVDLPVDTPPPTYRRLVTTMRDNPKVHGAVVTAHKLRLYRACAGDLSGRDTLVALTGEINTLATNGHVVAHANDARSLTAILDRPAGGRIVCVGAGGAATALLLALHLDVATGLPRPDPPDRLVFADIEPAALEALGVVADRIGARPSLVHLAGPADDLVADATLVVNATGLGKDRPGSPVTDAAPWRPGTVAWDLNYRGDLAFLRQATARGLSVMDGWDYFVAGWAGALTAIAGVAFTPPTLSALATVAAPHRPKRTDT
jgi:shikimate dehydrogenase